MTWTSTYCITSPNVKDYVGVRTSATLSTKVANPFANRFIAWRSQGLTTRASTVLALSGCETPEQVRDLGPEAFSRYGNVGAKTLAEIAALVGGWAPKTPQDAIAQALRMSLASDEEAQEAAGDALIALRRSGFVIVARRTAPGGSRHAAG